MEGAVSVTSTWLTSTSAMVVSTGVPWTLTRAKTAKVVKICRRHPSRNCSR